MDWHCHWPMSLPVQKQPIILDGAERHSNVTKKSKITFVVITILIV